MIDTNKQLHYLTVCSDHITYAFQSESTLYIYLNIKELLAWNRRHIWRLSDCSGTRTYNHLLRNQILKHLAKLASWLSCVVSTYLNGAFNCMFLSSHVRISEWIHTLYLSGSQALGTSIFQFYSINCDSFNRSNSVILRSRLIPFGSTLCLFRYN